VRLLGELALRVNDLAKMLAFYRDVVGLDVWREYADCVFFRIADGVEGHPQTLVLFDRNVEVDHERSTIDHFAFVIGLEDYDDRRRQLERRGMEVWQKEFPRFHWRSLFIADPEGNTVEFVCYDASV
jgi:extradiol dioxygenase family protein